jgi:hypothetical protein
MRPKYRSDPRSNDHNAAPDDIRISLIIYTLSITSKLNYLAHNIYIPQAFFPEKHAYCIGHTCSERIRDWSADLCVGRAPLLASFRSEITERGLESGG